MASFFHTPKPNTYHVDPRFWDPAKEKREQRERRIKAELGIKEDDGSYIPYITKGDFRQGISKGKWTPSTQRRKANTRLLLFIVLLSAAVYFILK